MSIFSSINLDANNNIDFVPSFKTSKQMACIVNDTNGTRRIQFIGPDGKKRTVRLGKIDRRSAESINRHVEELLGATIGGQPVARQTMEWLKSIGDKRKYVAALFDDLGCRFTGTVTRTRFNADQLWCGSSVSCLKLRRIFEAVRRDYAIIVIRRSD